MKTYHKIGGDARKGIPEIADLVFMDSGLPKLSICACQSAPAMPDPCLHGLERPVTGMLGLNGLFL